MFEEGEPPEREYVETPKELKEKALRKKLEDHKQHLKDLMKSCMIIAFSYVFEYFFRGPEIGREDHRRSS
jgi:hypothetical protein